ncbi:Anaphase-promoting complex subunit cut9 [Madurella mycetomatis]|uniref:Anaphase-promoting complex subunit cut9 n=1 Tax=Madurella mycetomatis TaxID=100816 RepID=A0A175VVY0_9PEZI|nr:Anaphase-promoting complex subunit cut9 [Madurella mycetomatis]
MASSQPNMERFLRDWRQDALNKAQYESAIFIGDKLLAMTKDDNDAFWLAQVHFAAGNYTRSNALLAKHNLIGSNPSCRYLAAHCLIRQNLFNDALALLGEHTPTHLFTTNAKRKTSRTGARGVRGGPKAPERQQDHISEEESSNRRHEAAMCYLRGLCYAKQNAFDRAKEAYKDALRIDVQCYEAFTQLVRNSLMSPDEEDDFMQSLDFNTVRAPQGGDDPDLKTEPGDYVHMLYQTQLSKYRNPRAFNTAIESLSTHYGLERNADILLARADMLYTQCRFKDALAITDSVLEDDKYNFAAYPIHLACLSELRKTNVLFLIAHELADSHPDEPCTWLAVGIYYFSTGKVADARRYFSKASMMDANFGPAWIGFAHTFAAEGEHDQAVTAYSTAARLFTGTHLPQVFLGMQNHAMNNMTAAEEFLKTAYSLCRTDPLLLNEMGVVLYHQDRLKDAAKFFREALRIAHEIDSDPHAWLGARTNLGHAYRRLRLLDEALDEFDAVLRDGGKDPAVFSAKGLIFLEKGLADEAVRVLHEALAVNPQDPIATELLSKALDESAAGDVGVLMGQLSTGGSGNPAEEGEGDDDGGGGEPDLERFEAELGERKAAARQRMGRRTRGRAAGGDKGKGVARGGTITTRGGARRGRESMMEMSDDE